MTRQYTSSWSPAGGGPRAGPPAPGRHRARGCTLSAPSAHEARGRGAGCPERAPTLYSMERRISVVMMRHGASGLIWTSPVNSPTWGRARGLVVVGVDGSVGGRAARFCGRQQRNRAAHAQQRQPASGAQRLLSAACGGARGTPPPGVTPAQPGRPHLEPPAEVAELLVADGLDGRGVHRAAAVLGREGKRVLRHDCLARAGVRRDKYLAAPRVAAPQEGAGGCGGVGGGSG